MFLQKTPRRYLAGIVLGMRQTGFRSTVRCMV